MSDTNKKLIIAVLLLSIIGLGIYSYLNIKKQQVKIDEITLQKEEIDQKLKALQITYDEAIKKNTSLSADLEEQKDAITKLRDSLKKIKNSNWRTIKFYKNKIEELNSKTNNLLVVNDSLAKRNELLNVENQDLYEQKQSLTTNLESQTKYNDTLTKQNLNLAKKVAIGSVVKSSNYSATTLRKRNNGKYKVTDKARRTDAFKISFVLNENPIADESDINSFVVIQNPQGKVLNSQDSFTNENGDVIFYSESTIIPYKKHTLATDYLINVKDQKLEKGDYLISIYLENKLVKQFTKTLG